MSVSFFSICVNETWVLGFITKLTCQVCNAKSHEVASTGIGWLGGNSSPLSVGGTLPTETPPKLHSISYITPTVGLFQTVTSAAQWISPQTKQPMKAIVTRSVRENFSYFGSLSVSLGSQTTAWLIGKLRSSTLLAWLYCFEVQWLKSLLQFILHINRKLMIDVRLLFDRENINIK